jgi:hypothetical protein
LVSVSINNKFQKFVKNIIFSVNGHCILFLDTAQSIDWS